MLQPSANQPPSHGPAVVQLSVKLVHTAMLAPLPLLLKANMDRSQRRGQHQASLQHLEQSEDTANLLHFIDMASSNIKLALDRPSKSKRKVNHRKYLQKQLKRCGDSPKKTDGSPAEGHASGLTSTSKAYRKEVSQIGLQIKSLQALFDPRTLHERRCAEKGSAPAAKQPASQKASLRNRNLPASFFVEPALRSCDKSDRDVMLSAVADGAAPLQLPAPAHQTHQYPVSAELGALSGTAGYPALPSDTLESILGHADLSELLAGQWHHRDSNTTPCEGSVGTCSPRSLSDSSDAYCTPSPGPSSASTRSPSWSPGFPALPGGHFASGVQPRPDEAGVADSMTQQYFMASSLDPASMDRQHVQRQQQQQQQEQQNQRQFDSRQYQQQITHQQPAAQHPSGHYGNQPSLDKHAPPMPPLTPDPAFRDFLSKTATAMYFNDQPHHDQLQHHHPQQQQQQQQQNYQELPTFPQAFSPPGGGLQQCNSYKTYNVNNGQQQLSGSVSGWNSLHPQTPCYSYLC